MEWLQIAPFPKLLTHSRFFLTLRSKAGQYHSLILFRLSPDAELSSRSVDTGGEPLAKVSKDALYKHIYVMESACPHLGADLSHSEIEEYEESIVAVCPWHRYDFDLRTGNSEATTYKACTYAVEIRTDSEGIDMVYIETPASGHEWKLVELRPVSEEFADPPAFSLEVPVIAPPPNGGVRVEEPVIPLVDAPRTLMQWAVLILNTPDPTLKVLRTRHAVEAFRTGRLMSIGNKAWNAPSPPDVPPREQGFTKNTVDPAKVKNRKNRAVMLHALANIEQWAIDLAWDIMARFGPKHQDLPPAFFSDFTKMALDESKHFTLLTSRLSAISPSTPYGSMPVHAGLWESATVTSDSLRSRLAIIHLVHEARGLDVNPGTIERFRKAGDKESVTVMETIHADEVTHVTSGHRWFTWICAQENEGKGVDPVAAFREEVRKGWRGDVKGPFNKEDRERAGLTTEFYEDLKGEMGFPLLGRDERLAEGIAKLAVGYEE